MPNAPVFVPDPAPVFVSASALREAREKTIAVFEHVLQSNSNVAQSNDTVYVFHTVKLDADVTMQCYEIVSRKLYDFFFYMKHTTVVSVALENHDEFDYDVEWHVKQLEEQEVKNAIDLMRAKNLCAMQNFIENAIRNSLKNYLTLYGDDLDFETDTMDLHKTWFKYYSLQNAQNNSSR